MRTISSTLTPCLYRLYSKPIQLVELYLSSPYTTPSHHFAARNKDVVFGGVTYTALAIKRNPIKMEEGTIINSLELGLDNIDLEFKTLIASGALNKKRCTCKLVFDGFLTNVSDYILLIDGELQAPKGDENFVTMTISPFECFSLEYPRRIFQVNCNSVFCDETCGLSLSDYTFSKTIVTITSTTITFANDSKTTNYFVPGYCEFIIDGVTVVRPISASTPTSITLRVALEENNLPEIGENFNAVKVCAKTLKACTDEFNNSLAFAGYPQVPREPVL